MKPDFIRNLPSEIIINILSRLSTRTTAISKCVCKTWLHLLQSGDFIKSHLSKSAPALAVLMPEGASNWCAVFEFEDVLDLDSRNHHYKQLTKFDFPHRASIQGSANGLLFLRDEANGDALYVCNPISREFIELRCPEGVTYGFGAGRITGQHKVVCINPPKSECHVYTLGTGSWRRVEATASFDYGFCCVGAFVSGNLHWMVSDPNGRSRISCFDVETECFTIFSAPPLRGRSYDYIVGLSCLKGCLCLCDSASEDEIVVWLMKEYGDEKSWRKEYVLGMNRGFDRDGYVLVYPIKVFRDGDVLMLWDEQFLFYYSNKMKTSQEIGMFDERDDYVASMLLTPTFLSLKCFRKENVIFVLIDCSLKCYPYGVVYFA